jgi:septal ring factor EnvC (AmiA/AmiB activator)
MEYGFYVGIASVFLALIAHAVKVTWQVRGMEADIRADMNAEIDNVQRDITRLERAGADRGETLRHEFGETGNALRTKIHEVETWNRDTFVRKDSFEMVIGRLEKSIDKLGDKIEERLDKMIERIKSKTE